MKKIFIKLYHSYEEADKDILNDYLLMTPEERIAAVNAARRNVFRVKDIEADNKVKRIISFGKRPNK